MTFGFKKDKPDREGLGIDSMENKRLWHGEGSTENSGISFVKMEGAGNDYVYVECFDKAVRNPQAFARRVSDRHRGIGSDGLILLKASPRADCFMDIYNADGSRGKACGNGLRCVAKLMYEKLGKVKKNIDVETLSGVRRCSVEMYSERKAWVKAQMGAANILDLRVPVADVAALLPAGVRIAAARMVDVGNPHCVLWLEADQRYESPEGSGGPNCGSGGVGNTESGGFEESFLARLDIEPAGRYLENYPGFPETVNVEFCTGLGCDMFMCDDGRMRPAVMARVWERGSGETLACGSGACAVFAAREYFAEHQMITYMDNAGIAEDNGCGSFWRDSCCVFMPGGRLCVERQDNADRCSEGYPGGAFRCAGQLLLCGEAVTVFTGSI